MLIERVKQFFETDVANSITDVVNEYIQMTGNLNEDEQAYIRKESALRLGYEYNAASLLHYTIFDDPYTTIYLDFSSNYFTAKTFNQMQTLNKFETGTFSEFRDYWNKFISEYYGDQSKLPKMPNFE